MYNYIYTVHTFTVRNLVSPAKYILGCVFLFDKAVPWSIREKLCSAVKLC